MEIRPRPLFIIMPWFKAFPGSDISMHYCWTFRRNPALHMIPVDHPQVKLLPEFMYNRDKDKPFDHMIKDKAHFILGIDERIAEQERWFDAHVVLKARSKKEFGRLHKVRITNRTVLRTGENREQVLRQESRIRSVWLYDHEVKAFGLSRASHRELGLESCDD